MDFQAAMETFAEAWVAANTPTAVNTEPSQNTSTQSSDLPTMMPKEKMMSPKAGGPGKDGCERKSPSPTGGAKSLPIHCVVEQVSGLPSFEIAGCQSVSVELDSYAILPSTTTLCELVRTALLKLGYSSSETMNAKGAIQLKNWKPLTFERITDNLQATVEDILGDLTNVATLKIRICSQPKLSSTDDVKEKLLQLLLNQSQNMLLSTGCPIDKVMLSSISQGRLPSDISLDTRRNFDLWFNEQLKKSMKQLDASSSVKTESSPAQKSSPAKSPVSTAMSTPSNLHSSSPHPSSTSTPMSSSGKHTRMRTSFDPEHEIPRLQKWFQVNQHPTREQMINFLSELNSLDSRKGRKQLDLTNIIYWFKNARAAFRRANKSADDPQADGDEALCMAFPDAEDSNKDEGGSGIEDRSESPVEESIPYLPNKNAVYVIPNPLHKVVLEEQATDLSTNKNKEERASPQPSCPSDSGDEDNGSLEIAEQREQTPSAKPEVEKDCRKRTMTPQSRKRRHSEESCPSEDEENEPGHKSFVKQEEENDHEYVDTQGHIPRDLPVLAQSPHNRLALSIPHMPHPLAMHYIPLNAQYYHAQLQQRGHLMQQQVNVPHSNSNHSNHINSNSVSAKAALDKKRRTRVFIDPLTEIPKLEQWFLEDTHPSAYMIDKYCEELNRSEYRRKYPKLEPKNVQLWFKNHRAKVKRMRIEGPGHAMNYKYDDSSPGAETYDYEQHNSQHALNYEVSQGRQIMSA